MAKGLQCFLSISLKPCTQEERFEVFSFKSVMHEMAFKVYVTHNFFLNFFNNGGSGPPFATLPNMEEWKSVATKQCSDIVTFWQV